MWAEILVKIFTSPFRGRQAGASTIAMVMISGITLVIVSATVAMMDKRKTYLEIVRMNTRGNLLEKQLQFAARSMSAMEISALAAGQGSSLHNCIVRRQCRSSSGFERYPLHNSGRVNLTGLRTLSGEECTGECPIRIDTFFNISCGGGASSCTQPGEILTRYTIAKNSDKYFGDREFNNRTGVASLSTFACEDDQYVTGIASDGTISCDRAIASRFSARCEAGSAAYGLSSQGLLKCSPVVDYCAQPIAFSYVLDTSGSMSSRGKIAAAKNSANAFVDRLKTGDRGSLTTFDSAAQLRSPLSGNLQNLKTNINAAQARGLTNMTAGLQVAANSLSGVQNGAKVMVFLSDGHHNRGGIDPVQAAGLAKAAGIRIYSIGFGERPDRNRLMQIASSPADYFDVNNAGDLSQTFNNLSQMMCRMP